MIDIIKPKKIADIRIKDPLLLKEVEKYRVEIGVKTLANAASALLHQALQTNKIFKIMEQTNG